jgi:putative selenate reductase
VHELQKAMRRLSATSIADFILEYREQRHTARNDPRQAGFLNTSILVQETINDRRYGKAQNSKEPRRIGSHLHLFDCITCDKCIPVCPNGANFLYRTIPRDTSYHDVQVQWDGSLRECGQLKRFQVARSEQIANFADYCNHCGNCDTFCPEYDGPYIIKPSFFGSRQAFERGAPHDGFLLERSDQTGQVRLRGRFNGQELWLEPLTNAEGFRFCDGVVTCRIAQDGQLGTEPAGDQPPEGHVVDVGRFHAMVALFQGITNPERIHPVNLPWLQPERSEAE